LKEESRLKTIIQVVVFTAAGGLILYLMWQSQGRAYAEDCILRGIAESDCSLLDKLIADFRSANIFWLIVISICFVISHVLRAVRWQMLLKPMGYRISHFNAFASVMVGYFANLGFPRFGELVRALCITKYEKVPIEKSVASIVIGRSVDVIMLLLLIGLGFIFHFDILWGYIQDNLALSSTTIGIGLALLIISGLIGLFILRKILALDDAGLHPIALKIKNLIAGFVDAFVQIKNLPNPTLFVGYSVGIWLMYFLMHYLAFFAYEPVSHLSAIDGILVFDFGSLGMVFPAPGGMGSYHYMIVEALKILGVEAVNGFSFAMITFFTLTIFCTVIIGLISLILLPIVNKK